MSAVVALSVVGCAGPGRVPEHLRSAQNEELCRSFLLAERAADFELEQARVREMTERGMSRFDCRALLGEYGNSSGWKDTVATLGAIALATAAVYLIVKGGGGPAYSDGDVAWDWDLFYDESRRLVWACRGVQTGQFADQAKCQGKLRSDARWPSLSAPR